MDIVQNSILAAMFLVSLSFLHSDLPRIDLTYIHYPYTVPFSQIAVRILVCIEALFLVVSGVILVNNLFTFAKW